MQLRLLICFAALALLGCRAKPPDINKVGGVVLTYSVAEENEPSKDAVEELASVLERRLDPTGGLGVVVEPWDARRVRIAIPAPDPATVENMKRMIAAPGRMEFRIIANPHDHAQVIEAALAEENRGAVHVKNNQGEIIGRWATAPKEDRGGSDVTPSGAILRNAGTLEVLTDAQGSLRPELLPEGEAGAALANQLSGTNHQALREYLYSRGIVEIEILIASNDGYNVASAHFEKLAAAFDDAGFPCIDFTMTDEGAILLQGLTGDFSPDPQTGFTRRFAVVLDDRLLAAPALRGIVGRDGQITGRFTQAEIDDIVNLLRIGELPVPLEEIPEREEAIAPIK